MINSVNLEKDKITFGNDSVVIQKYIAGLPGGRTLDLTGFVGNVVPCGVVIIRTGEGVYKPLSITPATEAQGDTPATPAAYAALPAGAKYAGVLYRSISAKDPEASIMIEGVVNGACLPAALPAGFNLPITVIEDEIA